MGSKAPYQTKQMAQLTDLSKDSGGYACDGCRCLFCISKSRGLQSERQQFTVIWRRWWSRGWSPSTMWTGRAVPVLNISEQRNTVTRPSCFHCKCEKCGKLIHLHCEDVVKLEQHLMESHGFQMDPCRTVFYGICEECQKSEPVHDQRKISR